MNHKWFWRGDFKILRLSEDQMEHYFLVLSFYIFLDFLSMTCSFPLFQGYLGAVAWLKAQASLCWVKPPRNFCDPTAWGLLAPRRGPDVLVRIGKALLLETLKELGSFLRHEHIRVSNFATTNPCFQKMCPDTLAPPVVFSAATTSDNLGTSGLESAWDAPGPRPKFKRLLPHQRPVRAGDVLDFLGVYSRGWCSLLFFLFLESQWSWENLEMGFLDAFFLMLWIFCQKTKDNEIFLFSFIFAGFNCNHQTHLRFWHWNMEQKTWVKCKSSADIYCTKTCIKIKRVKMVQY